MKVHHFMNLEALNLFLGSKKGTSFKVKIIHSRDMCHYYVIEREDKSERFEK